MSPREREDNILDHIGRYRVTLRAVLERLFFEDASCNNVVQRLVRQGKIRAREKGLAGKLNYYQLTTAEARRRVLPTSRAAALGARALHVHLGVLWFCCMLDRPRRRIEEDEVQSLFATLPSQLPHCAEDGNPPRIIRIQVTDPTARVTGVVKRFRRSLYDAVDDPKIAGWVHARRYAFALLAESRARKHAIQSAVCKDPMSKIADVIVALAPSAMTVREELQHVE